MAHTGFVQLGLLQTDGQPAVAPNTKVRIRDVVTNRNIGSVSLSFPPERRLEVPAFPETQVLVLEITPERYRRRQSGVFTVTSNETIARRLTVFRNPSKWQAAFTPFALLPVEFDELKRILAGSPGVRLLKGGPIGDLTGAAYDAISQPKQILAKAALLNLRLKLTATPDPTETRRNWFEYVEEIYEIDRERVVGRAAPELLDVVKAIRDDIGRFGDYKRAPSGEHFADYPNGFTVTRSRTLSIKTDETKGNLQICVAPARDRLDNPVVLFDADIDENGKLFAHLADLFKHPFTGGTHPFDIYEFLKLDQKAIPLGYELV